MDACLKDSDPLMDPCLKDSDPLMDACFKDSDPLMDPCIKDSDPLMDRRNNKTERVILTALRMSAPAVVPYFTRSTCRMRTTVVIRCGGCGSLGMR